MASHAKVIIAHSLGNDNFRRLLDLKYFNKPPPNIYLDLSAMLKIYEGAPMGLRQELVWVLRVLGPEKILFGSDAPQYSMESAMSSFNSKFMSSAADEGLFNEAEAKQIPGDNAKKMFGVSDGPVKKTQHE